MADKFLDILIIEDNPVDAGLLKAYLSKADSIVFNVKWLTTVSEAIAYLTQNRLDIVLLDLGLPDSQGIVTLKQIIRQDPMVPVIVLTGLDDEIIAQTALRQGAQDYLVKGQINKILLVRSIRYAIERKQIHEELSRHQEQLEDLVKERTAALRKSEEKYRAVMESTPDPIVVYDMQGAVTYINPAFTRVFGWEQEDLMGKKIDFVPDSEKEITQTSIDTLIRDEICFDIETKRITKYDQMVDVMISAAIYKDDLGNKLGTVVIFQDITKAKKAAEKLRQANEATVRANQELININQQLEASIQKANEMTLRAEMAAKVKSEFLANISHEIRTPLNGIIGMAELAFENELDDTLQNIFNVISTESNSLLKLINDILDFSKMEAGKFELEIIPFNIRMLMDDFANAIALRAEQKELEFITFVAPEIPPDLMGDPGRLRQILANITGNALKFTDQGEIFIKAEKMAEDDNKVRILFSVKDTGIGIPVDKQDKIFDSFTQADGTTTRKYGGTGLGTTISKQLVELMGGTIGLTSQPDVGTTFWFDIEFKKQAAMPSSEKQLAITLIDLNVLVIDDNPTIRHILIEYLKSWQCNVFEAFDAKTAMAVIREHIQSGIDLDMILLELGMQETDGFELATNIRQLESQSPIPIILLARSGMIGDAKRCRTIGIDGYLSKPIRRDDLQRGMESVLGLRRSRDTKAQMSLVTKHSLHENRNKNIRILLVEDYPTNQKVAMQRITNAGYQADLAPNGQIAFTLFQTNPYDIILMDIQMPVMDGYQATKCIRDYEKDHHLKPIPIIAMTAHAMHGDKEGCIKAGMDDYLSKPLRKKEFTEMIQKWVDTPQFLTPEPAIIKGLSPTPSESPIDIEKAIEEFEGDRDFMIKVLADFLDTVKNQIDLIQKALDEQNYDLIVREAHAIKGGAANLLANELSSVAAELEQTGKSGVFENITPLVKLLIDAYERLDAFTQNIVN